MAFNINNALAIQLCDIVAGSIDAGAGAGLLEIYTGSPPAAVETAPTGTLLGTLTFSDPSFGAASDQNPNALATANAISSDSSADATGTAGYFRATDSVGVNKFQGTIGLVGSGNPLELNSVSITLGSAISISSMTITMPE